MHGGIGNQKSFSFDAHYGDLMILKSDLDAYREKIFNALREAGHPVDAWQRELEAQIAADPLGRPRPFTTITPPTFGKITILRPGFTETIPHPRHSKPVPRCQAAKKRTGGKIQCSKFAIKGKHLCRTHGGAAGSGKLTDQGRQNQITAVSQHGNETVAKRRARSLASKELRRLERLARERSLISGLGSRGPYWKPNRVGQQMAHLKRGKRQGSARSRGFAG